MPLFIHFKCNKDTAYDDKRCRCEIPKEILHIKNLLRLFSLRSHKKSSTVWDFIMREQRLSWIIWSGLLCIVNNVHRFINEISFIWLFSRETVDTKRMNIKKHNEVKKKSSKSAHFTTCESEMLSKSDHKKVLFFP
jgi:hypothetical protein